MVINKIKDEKLNKAPFTIRSVTHTVEVISAIEIFWNCVLNENMEHKRLK